MSTIDVTDANFKELVIDSNKPVLVDFWAEWCGPCRALTPVLEEMAADYADKIVVAKVNVDENPATASQYGITSIPAVFGFKNGEKVAQSIGAKPRPALEQDFADLLK